jgi:amidophosphoribosyltransferase
MLDRLTDALKQVEGAYSLVGLTEEGMIACRDPLGIRPLVMGKLGEATDGRARRDRSELPARC